MFNFFFIKLILVKVYFKSYKYILINNSYNNFIFNDVLFLGSGSYWGGVII